MRRAPLVPPSGLFTGVDERLGRDPEVSTQKILERYSSKWDSEVAPWRTAGVTKVRLIVNCRESGGNDATQRAERLQLPRALD
eukprot:6483748-Amphidinium_carterae.1